MYEDIIQARLEGYKRELYDNQINLRIAQRVGDEASAAQFAANIATIEVAIEEWENELNA